MHPYALVVVLNTKLSDLSEYAVAEEGGWGRSDHVSEMVYTLASAAPVVTKSIDDRVSGQFTITTPSTLWTIDLLLLSTPQSWRDLCPVRLHQSAAGGD